MENNPFEDIIQLSKQETKISEKFKIVDVFAETVEARQRSLFKNIEKKENNSDYIPDSVIELLNRLNHEVENRKKTRHELDSVQSQIGIINNFSKIILNRNSKKPSQDEKNTIEVKLVEYELLLNKQERLLAKRKSILEEEDRLITEIEEEIDSKI